MLFAVAVFAAAFAFARLIGVDSIRVPLLIAIPSGCLALLSQRRDFKRILRSFIWTAVGAFTGFLLCPAVSPPYEPGDAFRYMIGGALVGWVVGAVLNRSRERVS